MKKHAMKLKLGRETIAHLVDTELRRIRGGHLDDEGCMLSGKKSGCSTDVANKCNTWGGC